jgi:hypothetical protein
MADTGQPPSKAPISEEAVTRQSSTLPGPAAVLLGRLAERLGMSVSVNTVYGEPVKGDGVTVIPVARVVYGLGGGTGRQTGTALEGEGGGGGGGVIARPAGFIEIRDGVAAYKPIRGSWARVVVPAAALAAVVVGPRIGRVLGRRERG